MEVEEELEKGRREGEQLTLSLLYDYHSLIN